MIEFMVDKDLIKMLGTLICQHEGPVQIRDEAIELYNKYADKPLFYDEQMRQWRRLMEEEALRLQPVRGWM